MQTTRRRMMMASSALAAVFATRTLFGQMTPQPLPSPNAPRNQNVPAGLDGAEIPVRNGQRVIPPASWMEIQSDAQKLLDLATDFKKRVDQSSAPSPSTRPPHTRTISSACLALHE